MGELNSVIQNCGGVVFCWHFRWHSRVEDFQTIAAPTVRFGGEGRNRSPQASNWFRSYGNENWEFNQDGLMARRFASINDLPIKESERKFLWPLGQRPDEHKGLSDFNL